MPSRRLTPTTHDESEPGPPGAPTQPGRQTAIHLQTERLEITPLSEADIDAFVAYRRDPQVARFQSWDVDYDPARAHQLIAHQPAHGGLASPGQWVQLALRRRKGGQLIGDIGLNTNSEQPDTYTLGVTLATPHRGHGLATEACRTVLGFLFGTAGAHRVTATCDVRNTASSQLLHRLGMRHEARHQDADWHSGQWTTVDTYAVLDRDHSPTADWAPAPIRPETLPPVRARQDNPVRGVSFLGVHTDAFLDMRHLYAYVYRAPLVHEAPGVAWFTLADGAELHLYAATDTYHRFFGHAPVAGLLVDDYTHTEQRLTEFGVEWLTQPDTANGRVWRHYRAPDGNIYEVMGPDDARARENLDEGQAQS